MTSTDEGTVCGAIGTQGGDPIPHVHNCALKPLHAVPDTSGGVEMHRCLCGESWGGVETLSLELSGPERRDVAAFHDKAEYARRMSAFSIDLSAGLVLRIDAILTRLTAEPDPEDAL